MKKGTLEQIFDKAFERYELKKLIKEELFKVINIITINQYKQLK